MRHPLTGQSLKEKDLISCKEGRLDSAQQMTTSLLKRLELQCPLAEYSFSKGISAYIHCHIFMELLLRGRELKCPVAEFSFTIGVLYFVMEVKMCLSCQTLQWLCEKLGTVSILNASVELQIKL